MFWKLPDDTYRLVRPGDHAHPSRKGKTKPERTELPEQYRYLLDWYEQIYCTKGGGLKEDDDPIRTGTGRQGMKNEERLLGHQPLHLPARGQSQI
jgi:hypothetical protein